MKQRMINGLLAAGLCMSATAVNAQVFEGVTFDCTGALSQVVETAEGVRGTGLVNLTVDLPGGGEWRSSGVLVLALSPNAAGRDVDGLRINRCIGEGTLEATLTGQAQGVDVYRLSLQPDRVRIRVGNRRFSDPTGVEFSSTASGSPNV